MRDALNQMWIALNTRKWIGRPPWPTCVAVLKNGWDFSMLTSSLHICIWPRIFPFFLFILCKLLISCAPRACQISMIIKKKIYTKRVCWREVGIKNYIRTKGVHHHHWRACSSHIPLLFHHVFNCNCFFYVIFFSCCSCCTLITTGMEKWEQKKIVHEKLQ